MTIKTAPITIPPPDLRTLEVTIDGTAPLLINKFSAKRREQMRQKQEAGSQAKKGRARDPRDFKGDFEAARHRAASGWDGIHAAAFRNAMISACRLVGFKMTLAKLSLFIVADGLDVDEGTPLVKIEGGKPEVSEMIGRVATGEPTIVIRPMWRKWWVTLRIRYDAAQFSATDVVNLLHRAGAQVGVGEGRPDSKSSAGMGFGTFAVRQDAAAARRKKAA